MLHIGSYNNHGGGITIVQLAGLARGWGPLDWRPHLASCHHRRRKISCREKEKEEDGKKRGHHFIPTWTTILLT
jgi:hypothetical protein